MELELVGWEIRPQLPLFSLRFWKVRWRVLRYQSRCSPRLQSRVIIDQLVKAE
jgi:hypothetical protein